MHITADAEDVRVQLGHNMADGGAFPIPYAVAGPRELRVQRLAEQGERRVQHAPEDEAIPRRKVRLVVVHEDPGAAPMGHHQGRYHGQRQYRVANVQKSLRPAIRGLGHGLVPGGEIHPVYRGADGLAVGKFPRWGRGTVRYERLTYIVHHIDTI